MKSKVYCKTKRSDEFTEWCPHCEGETAFKRLRLDGVHRCKTCRKSILICSMCKKSHGPCTGCSVRHSKFVPDVQTETERPKCVPKKERAKPNPFTSREAR